MIGLTRAFFFTGVRSVVTSLWDVEDTSTAQLMQRFYANLRSGQPIDVALQHARLDLLHAGGTTSAPFYWAAFVATGQARAVIDVPGAPARRTMGWSLGLGAAAAFAVFVALLWRRRKPANSCATASPQYR